jgi:hypothetical protein
MILNSLVYLTFFDHELTAGKITIYSFSKAFRFAKIYKAVSE